MLDKLLSSLLYLKQVELTKKIHLLILEKLSSYIFLKYMKYL